MNKIKNILQSIRIEEYILFLFCLILFLFFITLFFRFNWLVSFRSGFKVVVLGINYFSFVLIFIYFYISFKYLFNWLYHHNRPKIKNILKNALFSLRPLFSMTIFFILITLVIGSMAIQLRGNLIDGWLMGIDKSLLGFYPFLWFQQSTNFLKNLAPLFLYSFLWLGLIMGISWIIFYLAGQRKFFSQSIMAMSLVVMIALPLWYFFPANSPQNTYLNNVYNKQIDSSIKELTDNYQPNKYLLSFHKEIGVEQGEIAPVTTMPSMHVAWTIVIIYYLFKFKRKTIYFTLPWAFFSILGTVYLAQHYFIDILVALLVALLAICLANCLVKIEKRYYQEGKLDNQEKFFKEEVKKDLSRIYQIIKELFRYFYRVQIW